jgi:superoxide dismutase, Cu-Zn family
MRRLLFASIALVPLLAGCESVPEEQSAVPAPAPSTDAGGEPRTTLPNITITMFRIDAKGVGAEIGTMMLMDSRGGLRIVPALSSLPPGPHGFHLHENPDCGPAMKDGKMQAGMAAGPHFDPNATGKHQGPQGDGHKGDLPVLVVDAKGNASETMHALRLSVSSVKGRAFVIHEGGDNFADQPKPLGGGSARIACGTVPAQ